jgi:phosphatidylinositol-3-phosphatase
MLKLNGFARALALGAALAGATGLAHADPKAPRHIFVIMMENHGYSEILGNAVNTPYISSLSMQFNVASNYFGVTHPSLPNYLAAISGSHQGIWDDCKAGASETCAVEEFVPGTGDGTDGPFLTSEQQANAAATAHLFAGQTIIDQLESRGLSWRVYMQSMPSAGFEGEYWPGQIPNGPLVKLYAQKHNPFMYFSNINSPGNPRLQSIVPYDAFAADLAADHVPNFVWISPDQCNDMHGISAAAAAYVNNPGCASDPTTVAAGDAFVQSAVTLIMGSKVWRREPSSIVIIWDEDDYTGFDGCCGSPRGVDGVTLGGAHVPALVINSFASGHKSTGKPANHYTLLGTLERLWGLGCLGATCRLDEDDLLTELFRP